MRKRRFFRALAAFIAGFHLRTTFTENENDQADKTPQ
jgi:hypothetical protein